MSPEWVSILALAALFLVGTLLPINMGALAFVAAWLVGMWSLGLDEKEIIGGMSGDLVLTLVGVTYLFAIARNNGTVDLIVRKAVQAVGGRVALRWAPRARRPARSSARSRWGSRGATRSTLC
jgi:hypothetical protein